MIRIWSEVPGARVKELIADTATVAWVALWGGIAWQLYETLAAYAGAGRDIHSGGLAMIDRGRELGAALAGIPLVGPGLDEVARNAFGGVGSPLSGFGTDLEQFILLVATVLAFIVALITLVPWLNRYLPWRWERLRRMRAGHRAIRLAPSLAADQVQAVLAMRAISRLDFATLLDYTPDPLGDWAAGRHDRLAQAELASVGLRA